MKTIYKRTQETNKFFELLQREHHFINLESTITNFKREYKGEQLQLDVYIRKLLAIYRVEAINKILRKYRLNSSWVSDINKDGFFIGKNYLKRFIIYNKKRAYKERYVPLGECDNLIFINFTPSIINFRYKEFPRSKKECSELIKKIFKKQSNYIITTKENIGKRSEYFEKRGGYVITIPKSKQEIKDIIRYICIKQGFKLKD